MLQFKKHTRSCVQIYTYTNHFFCSVVEWKAVVYTLYP